MKATFENKDNVLWPGLSVVDARFWSTRSSKSIVVPERRGPARPERALRLRRRRRQQGRDAATSRSARKATASRSSAGPDARAEGRGRRASIGCRRARWSQPQRGRTASPAPRQRGRRTPQPRRPDHGWRHLRAVHSASDRDLAVDGRRAVRRHRRLSAAAGRAAAAGRFPDHPGLRAACPAPARRPWPRRWRSRSRRNSRRSPASRR